MGTSGTNSWFISRPTDSGSNSPRAVLNGRVTSLLAASNLEDSESLDTSVLHRDFKLLN